MTRRPTTVLVLVALLTILGAFAAEALLKEEVCISAMIQDATSVTYYGTVCE